MTRTCFMVLVVALFPVEAQESTGTITGHVFDSTGAAIAGVVM